MTESCRRWAAAPATTRDSPRGITRYCEAGPARRTMDHSDITSRTTVPANDGLVTPVFRRVDPKELHGTFTINGAAGDTGSIVFKCGPRITQRSHRLLHENGKPKQFYSEVAGSGVVGAESLSLLQTACKVMKKAALGQSGNALFRVNFAFSVTVDAAQQTLDHHDATLANPRARLPAAAVLQNTGDNTSLCCGDQTCRCEGGKKNRQRRE